MRPDKGSGPGVDSGSFSRGTDQPLSRASEMGPSLLSFFPSIFPPSLPSFLPSFLLIYLSTHYLSTFILLSSSFPEHLLSVVPCMYIHYLLDLYNSLKREAIITPLYRQGN